MIDDDIANFARKVAENYTLRQILERFGYQKGQDSDLFIKKLLGEFLWQTGTRSLW